MRAKQNPLSFISDNIYLTMTAESLLACTCNVRSFIIKIYIFLKHIINFPNEDGKTLLGQMQYRKLDKAKK